MPTKKFKPSTVTDDPPDGTMFGTATRVTTPTSYVNNAVTVPTMAPTETATVWAPTVPVAGKAACPHSTVVSEVHEAEAHATLLKLAVADTSTLYPKLTPDSVSEAAPVDGAFGELLYDTTGASNVSSADWVPTTPLTDSVAAFVDP